MDIQPIIACLCTRVKDPTKGDWNKLVKMMKYLHSTREMILTMSAENGINCIAWYIDTAFGVHPDYKSHKGSIMKFKGGKGAVITMSRKQKLMTKSSTEAELVGVDDALVLVLWCKLFIEAQGYEVKENIIYRDNKSVIY